jgi:UDP-3-O-[3-hydroxymyristoyl] glucosamine N-acyltransferase
VTIDRSFFSDPKSVSIATILELGTCSLKKGSSDFVVKDINNITQAASGVLVFAKDEKQVSCLSQKSGYVIITTAEIYDAFGNDVLKHSEIILVAETPRYVFAQICSLIYPDDRDDINFIHPTAIIDKTAQISEGVVIGPFCHIASGVHIGAGSRLGVGVTCDRSVIIGNNCKIGDYVTLEKVILGDNIDIGAQTVIGKAGFGFEISGDDIQKIPHFGRVLIGSNTSIGSNSCIDRGTFGDTVISELVMIDNMVHIAHNVQIGRKSCILAQAGIAGSSVIQENCIIGGQTGISDHVNITSNTIILSHSGVTKSITIPDVYVGFPATNARSFWREQAKLRKLDKKIKNNDKD